MIQQQPNEDATDVAWRDAIGANWQTEEQWGEHMQREAFRWAHYLADTDEARALVEAELRSLDGSCFSSAQLEAQWRAAIAILDDGDWPNWVSISAHARTDPKQLDVMGGWETIAACWFMPPGQFWAYPCAHQLRSIVRWLREHAAHRATASALARAQIAVMRHEDVVPMLDAMMDPVDERSDEASSHGQLLDAAWVGLLGKLAKPGDHVTTTFVDLDKALGPLDPGSLTIIGGRPGDGKSSLALAIMERSARMGVAAGAVSVEDPEDVWAVRVAAMVLGVPQELFRSGAALTRNQGERHEHERTQGARSLAWAAFRVGAPIGEVLRAMSTLARRRKCRIIAVDYVQAIRGDESVDRRHEIRRSAQALKAHASRLGVALILASQLRRREDTKRPTMSDLRDAGELEEMAENVVLLWREGSARRAVAAKAKAGPGAGTVFEMEWDDVSASVRDLVRVDDDQQGARGWRQ